MFSIGKAGAAGKTVSELTAGSEVGTVTETAFGIARGVTYASIALAIGCLVFLLAVWLPGSPERRRARAGVARRLASVCARRLRLLMIVALAAGVVSEALQIVFQGATAAGITFWSALDVDVIREVLETRFGTVHLIACGGVRGRADPVQRSRLGAGASPGDRRRRRAVAPPLRIAPLELGADRRAVRLPRALPGAVRSRLDAEPERPPDSTRLAARGGDERLDRRTRRARAGAARPQHARSTTPDRTRLLAAALAPLLPACARVGLRSARDRTRAVVRPRSVARQPDQHGLRTRGAGQVRADAGADRARRLQPQPLAPATAKSLRPRERRQARPASALRRSLRTEIGIARRRARRHRAARQLRARQHARPPDRSRRRSSSVRSSCSSQSTRRRSAATRCTSTCSARATAASSTERRSSGSG